MITASGKVRIRRGVQRQREAGFEHWCASYFSAGRIEIEADGKKQIVVADSLLIISAGQAYRFEVIDPTSEIWCLFTPRAELFDFLPDPRENCGIHLVSLARKKSLNSEIASAMGEVNRWWSATKQHPLLAENALERALLLASLSAHVSRKSELDPRVVAVMNLLEQKVAEPHSVSELAKHAGMSVSNLAHLFRQQVGCTPQQFRTQQRMALAKRLLQETSLRVHEVAEATGFSNEFHFSSRFSKETGTSPRAFRTSPEREWGGLPKTNPKPPRLQD